jgi:uncharacterized membrane protein HdeD (DUF308 family)
MLIGISGIFEPWDTFLYLVKYLGFVLLLSSSLLFIHAFAMQTVKGEVKWLIVQGLTDMTFASVLIFNPFLAIIAFPLLIATWAVVRGVIRILHYAFLTKTVYGANAVLHFGILFILFGILIIMFPAARVHGLSYAISFFALLSGGLYFFDAVRFKKFEDTIVALL